MNIGTMQFMSKALRRHVTYTVLLPDGEHVGPGPYPVLYQLHGSSDDHSAWLNMSNLVRYVRDLPLIVVLPDGGISSWANLTPHEHYEDFLMNDLAKHLRDTFPVRAGKWAIGGLSMGGFGSMRLGLKYPDRFCSIWSHSGAFSTIDERRKRYENEGMANIVDLEDLDVYALVDKLDPKTMPKISFDCGTEDRLIESNRRLHKYLTDHDIPHTYKEHPGAHTWDYWDTHVPEAIRQHAQELGIEKQTASNQ